MGTTYSDASTQTTLIYDILTGWKASGINLPSHVHQYIEAIRKVKVISDSQFSTKPSQQLGDFYTKFIPMNKNQIQRLDNLNKPKTLEKQLGSTSKKMFTDWTERIKTTLEEYESENLTGGEESKGVSLEITNKPAKEFWELIIKPDKEDKIEWRIFVEKYDGFFEKSGGVQKVGPLKGPIGVSTIYITKKIYIQAIADYKFPFEYDEAVVQRWNLTAKEKSEKPKGNSVTRVWQKARGNTEKYFLAIASGDKQQLSLLVTENNSLLTLVADGGKTGLHLAAESGKLEIVRLLVENKIDIEAKNTEGVTALDIATRWAHLDVVKYLKEKIKTETRVDYIVRAENPDAVDYLLTISPEARAQLQAGSEKKTLGRLSPVHACAALGQVGTMRTIIKHGADLNIRDENGRTPLHHSVTSGSTDTAIVIAQTEGVDTDASDNKGITPLGMAMVCGTVDTISALVQAGVDPNVVGERPDGESGYAPIHLLTAREKVEPGLVPKLVELGTDLELPDAQGRTALMFSALTGSKNGALEELTSAGANLDAQDFQGRTAALLASATGKVEVIKELASLGANLQTTDFDGKDIVQYAKDVKTLTALTDDFHASVNVADRNGDTPLLSSARKGKADETKFLIDHNADLLHVNKQGETVIHAAAESSNGASLAVVLPLIKEKDFQETSFNDMKTFLNKPNTKTGKTALHAIATNNVEGIATLVEAGADPNIQDKNGRTALHDVASSGDEKGVHALLKVGVEVDKEDVKKQTAIFYSAIAGNASTAKALCKAGAKLDQIDSEGRTASQLAGEDADTRLIFDEEQLAQKGAHPGELAISLSWDDYHDLDLHVIPPSGKRIYFCDKKSECGGELDVDVNVAPTTKLAGEHIVWKNNPPIGRYLVVVDFFADHSGYFNDDEEVGLGDAEEAAKRPGFCTLPCAFNVSLSHDNKCKGYYKGSFPEKIDRREVLEFEWSRSGIKNVKLKDGMTGVNNKVKELKVKPISEETKLEEEATTLNNLLDDMIPSTPAEREHDRLRHRSASNPITSSIQQRLSFSPSPSIPDGTDIKSRFRSGSTTVQSSTSGRFLESLSPISSRPPRSPGGSRVSGMVAAFSAKIQETES